MATKLDQYQTSSPPIVRGLRFKISDEAWRQNGLISSIYEDVQILHRIPKLRGPGRLSLQKRSANNGFQV